MMQSMALKRGSNSKTKMLWALSREKDFVKLKKGCNRLMILQPLYHTKSQSFDQIHHTKVEEQQ